MPRDRENLLLAIFEFSPTRHLSELCWIPFVPGVAEFAQVERTNPSGVVRPIDYNEGELEVCEFSLGSNIERLQTREAYLGKSICRCKFWRHVKVLDCHFPEV